MKELIIYILTGILILIVVPIFIHLCVKWGTTGYYRGKEDWKEKEKPDVRTFKDMK